MAVDANRIFSPTAGVILGVVVFGAGYLFGGGHQKQLKHPNMASRSQVEAYVGAFGQPSPGQKRAPGYLEALRSRLADRAYPFDAIDPEQYPNAVAHARRMPKASLGAVGLASGPIVGKGSGGQETLPRYWEYVGPTNLTVPYTTYYGPSNGRINGRVAGLAFDPKNSNIIFMAAPAGGLWKTTNGGTTWTAIGDHFAVPYTNSVAVNPKNSAVVIAGLGDHDGSAGSGNGIMRSEDGGNSWANVFVKNGIHVNRIVFDPDNPSIVLLAATGTNGLFRSVNGGYTFSAVTMGTNTTPRALDLTVGIPDANGNRMYTAHVTGDGLYVSFNKGQTWTKYAEPGSVSGRVSVAASKVTPNRIYYSNDAIDQVHRGDFTPGTGFTFTNLNATGIDWGQAWYDNHLTVAKHTLNGLPTDYVYAGLISVHAYNGSTWTDVAVTASSGAKSHNDQHAMAVFPGNENIMVIGNDGGVWPTTYTPGATGNGTWAITPASSATLGITMFYHGAWHPTDPTRMMGGSQDNASPVSTGNLAAWVNRTGGDGNGCVVNPVTPTTWYGSLQYNSIYRTTNGWSSQGTITPSWGTDRKPFVTRMAIDPTSPNPLYVATDYLWKFNPGTGTWTSRLGGQQLAATGTVRSIAVAPSNPNVIYAGTGSGEFWRTTNGGTNWTKLSTITNVAFGSGSVTSISVHPTQPNSVLFTRGSSSNGYLQQIADASLATPVLQNVSGTGATALPSIAAFSVTRSSSNPTNTWYLANDVGVFMTTNGGANWSNATEPLGLPVCEGSQIEWTPGTGYLNLATYGRGMWRIRINDSRASDDTTLEMSPNAAYENGYFNVRVKVVNSGLIQANNVRITGATLTFPKNKVQLRTSLPIRLGMIDAGLNRSMNLIYEGSKLRDMTGKLTLSGTYEVGTTVKSMSWSGDILIP